jgi:pseudouridine-5'-phosphate glycosidase
MNYYNSTGKRIYCNTEFISIADLYLFFTDANKNLHLGSGILIAVPIPKEHAASGNAIESAIQKALKEAEYCPYSQPPALSLYLFCVFVILTEMISNDFLCCFRDKNIIGNAITPFMLDRVKVLTGRSSLEANIALVKNNALVGAKIAVALSDLHQRVTNRFRRSAL